VTLLDSPRCAESASPLPRVMHSWGMPAHTPERLPPSSPRVLLGPQVTLFDGCGLGLAKGAGGVAVGLRNGVTRSHRGWFDTTYRVSPP
jgi:hypothetical protein